ncbi:uncharacterized protein DS421_19g655830 [Arachis hypogaea]|uniref:Uncharacterized protein n=1 Tax=Arachis hypogaea TaxID=3818 RepID=A0A6B9VC57_ARAHY|nr:uncharacterized protein DS421_19g655830 [Arachis hypogaea]
MGKIRNGDSLGLGDVAFSGSRSFSSLPQSMHSLISLAILSDRIPIPWKRERQRRRGRRRTATVRAVVPPSPSESSSPFVEPRGAVTIAVQPRPAAPPWSPLLRACHCQGEAAVASCPTVTVAALELTHRRH